MTDAERRLWSRLRAHGLDGYKFRRQYPIGQYVADFACRAEHLVIELDGGGHGEDRAELDDARRTQYLEKCGYRVLRFWNLDVLTATDRVVGEIIRALDPSSSDGLITAPAKSADLITAPAMSADLITAPAMSADVITAPAMSADLITAPLPNPPPVNGGRGSR